MSVTTWDPTQKPNHPELTRVRGWTAQAWPSADALVQLSDDDRHTLQAWITLDWTLWEPVISQLTASELVHLMQLMTLAEGHIGGCDAGAKSTVIHAFRQHKAKFGAPDKELVRWIKANTQNRFLPYGPVL
ncbi:hypothetical protein NFC81_11395 [Salinispirillum sp. LH 10-3-1]|uniref:DUF3135 domain-containing protein n=1 Tax=Salinispirillum sp. LH 10-3-1 TaxID=2952525 RepID=A0AB38YD47_9GAMM